MSVMADPDEPVASEDTWSTAAPTVYVDGAPLPMGEGDATDMLLASNTAGQAPPYGYYSTWQSTEASRRYRSDVMPAAGYNPYVLQDVDVHSNQAQAYHRIDDYMTPLVPGEAMYNFPTQNGLTSVSGSSGLWLTRNFNPNDAELKAGPLFIDICSLELVGLYSDISGPFAETLPEDGFIAAVGLTVRGMLRITPTTFLEASGTFYYVPTEGDAGFFFGGGGGSFVRFEHQTQIGAWDILFFDVFDVFHPLSQLLSDVGNSASAVSGRYRLGYEYAFTERPFSDEYLYFRNIVGVTASTMLTENTRLRLGFDHLDTWQTSDFEHGTQMEHFSAGVFYDSPDLWFMPWATYDLYWYEGFEDPRHQALVGATFPFSKSLIAFARAGYTWDENWDGSFLWDVYVNHRINSSWSQSAGAGYTYQLSPIGDDFLGYNARYSLDFAPGGRVSAGGFVQWGGNDLTGSDQWVAGATSTVMIDSKTSAQGSMFYMQEENDFGFASEAWIYRAELLHSLSRTINLRLTYQLTDYEANTENTSYNENLFMLTVTKYF
jgi:hypothetical protein